jgi:hypothetical protein
VSELRLATVNLRQTLTPRQAQLHLGRVLEHGPAAVAVQERGAATLGTLPPGYRAAGGPRPVLLDRHQLRLRDTVVLELAPGRQVAKLPGRRARLGPTTARLVLVERLEDGAELALLNVHLPAAVETDGRPRYSLTSARQDQHREALHALSTVCLALRAARLDPFVLGDLNVHARADLERRHPVMPVQQLGRVGLRSCWQGNLPSPLVGTLGRRLVDGVWSLDTAREVLRVPGPSDHDGVLVVYP